MEADWKRPLTLWKCWTSVLHAFAPLLKSLRPTLWLLLVKNEGEDIQGEVVCYAGPEI